MGKNNGKPDEGWRKPSRETAESLEKKVKLLRLAITDIETEITNLSKSDPRLDAIWVDGGPTIELALSNVGRYPEYIAKAIKKARNEKLGLSDTKSDTKAPKSSAKAANKK